MALAQDTTYWTAGRRSERYRIADAVQVFAGALVGVDLADGLLKLWSDTATMRFLGYSDIGDTTGDTSAAVPPEIPVNTSGDILKKVSVAGVTGIGNVGAEVHATDDNTLTLTASTNVEEIGYVTRFYSGTTVDVRLYTAAEYRARVGA